jgi:type IV fimbrial biogenesis protein FimT
MAHPEGTGVLNLEGRARVRGFTLVELVVTIALLSLLLGLAAPAFSVWVRNARVRTAADSLANAIRLAQGEAMRRNRQVVFFFTSSGSCDSSLTASSSGSFWAVRTVALTSGDPVEAVQCGLLTDAASTVSINGATAVCFNSMGRQIANAAPGLGTGIACTLDPSGTSTFIVSRVGTPVAGSDRPLHVLVALSGQVRQCDPARTQSSTALDGCP